MASNQLPLSSEEVCAILDRYIANPNEGDLAFIQGSAITFLCVLRNEVRDVTAKLDICQDLLHEAIHDIEVLQRQLEDAKIDINYARYHGGGNFSHPG